MTMENTKNKIEIVEELAERLGTTKVDAEKYLEAVKDTIVDNLADGYDVKLSGFAHFKLVEQNARKVYIPTTGNVVDVPNKRRINIRPMGKLKNLIENNVSKPKR